MSAITSLLLTLLGCGLLGAIGCVIEKIARHNADLLPPPNKHARRTHYQEFQS